MSTMAATAKLRVFSSLLFAYFSTCFHPSTTCILVAHGFVVRVSHRCGIKSPTSLSSSLRFPLHLTKTTHYSLQEGGDDELVVPTTSRRIIETIAFLVPSEDATSKTHPPPPPSKFGIHSPVDRPSHLQAAKQLASKATWFSENQVDTYIVKIGEESEINDNKVDLETVRTTLEDANILVALGLSTKEDLEFAQSVFQKRKQQRPEDRFAKCQFALDCGCSSLSYDLPAMVGPYDEESSSASTNPSLLLPWTDVASGRRFYEQMEGLFARWTSDDFTVALMLFLNRFSGSAVDWVKDSADATWEKGPIRNAQEFYQMGKV
jgi:hypothetical protein